MTKQEAVIKYIEDNYLQFKRLRHDVISDKLQLRMEKPTPAPSLKGGENSAAHKSFPSGEDLGKASVWREMTKHDINSIVCHCAQEYDVNITSREVMTALQSDLIPDVHPLREYILSLPPFTPDQPDWIDFVAKQVHVRSGAPDRPSGCRSARVPVDGRSDLRPVDRAEPCRLLEVFERSDLQQSDPQCSASETIYSEQRERSEANAYWRICFKKWFVAMVASWMKDEVVNHTVLVFVGRQGIFKTTWMDHLIPPALRSYSSKLPLSGQISKDDRLRLCENAMLNIDALDAICGREMNIVKSLLTSTDVNERAAYGRLKERRVRLASFCASTNNREFLTDVTGNRRWLPFEVESIQNPFHITLPYERIYAQAKALVEEGKFIYWFDLEDIEQLEQHNEEFRAQDSEEQLLPILFDVPAEGKGEFMTTAEISDKLVTYGGIKKPMALNRLGVLLGKAGYRTVTRGSRDARVRGWIVYQRDNEQINANRRLLIHECVTV